MSTTATGRSRTTPSEKSHIMIRKAATGAIIVVKINTQLSAIRLISRFITRIKGVFVKLLSIPLKVT
jgi:hypothetical protein